VQIWDGGTPGIIANHTETLRLEDLQTAKVNVGLGDRPLTSLQLFVSKVRGLFNLVLCSGSSICSTVGWQCSAVFMNALLAGGVAGRGLQIAVQRSIV
jgi:hypothetical protein